MAGGYLFHHISLNDRRGDIGVTIRMEIRLIFSGVKRRTTTDSGLMRVP